MFNITASFYKYIAYFYLSLLVLGLLVLASSSAMAEDKLEKLHSDFFADYSIFKTVKAPEGMQLMRYVSPKFDPLSYQFVIIDPIHLNQTLQDGDISPEIIANTQQSLDKNIREKIVQFLGITDKPSKETIQLRVSISGAKIDGEGFKPRNILPISAAIKLASKATGKDKKTPVLVIESKLTDSVSGELLKGTIISISGDSFRDSSDAGQAFQNLSTKLVDLAIKSIPKQ